MTAGGPGSGTHNSGPLHLSPRVSAVAVNDFDKAARYAARMDPEAFLGWALNLPAEAFGFRGWEDTRGVVFPGGDDRTGDTVAHLTRADTGGEPWLFGVEFQVEPDPRMFGRMLQYLGNLWDTLRPDDGRGSRFASVGVLLNLTGTGNTSRSYSRPAAGVNTTLSVRERNLETESAADLLGRIDTGAVGRAVLPWVPLLAGAGEPGIVERWKALAEAESDDRRKSNYGGLALVFADAAGRFDLWSRALEGWNMKRSRAVLQWLDEGEQIGVQKGEQIGIQKGEQLGLQKGQRVGQLEILEAALTSKFGPLSAETLERLRQLPDEQLKAIPARLFSANTLAELGLSRG